jgi:PIN domain nuclease of toxin-antitoxin system
MVVLDTHVLIWWTLDPAQLSPQAQTHCAAAAEKGVLVSAISIWEIGIKVRRGQLDLGLELDDYVRRLRSVGGLEIEAVGVEQWLANLALPWDHRDPADRTIVATAQRRDLPLISKDAAIQAFYPKAIW